MALILNIETATEVCSVALANEEGVLDYQENTEGKSHASLLTTFVDALLKNNNILPCHLDAIAVSSGPGSYTGLRIGVSAAKGLCYGANKPLLSIPTLQCMAYGFITQLSEDKKSEYKDAWLCPMIDARRLEVYMAFFDLTGDFRSEIRAEIIDENSFDQILGKRKILLFGNGSDKCKSIIHHPNAIFHQGFLPSAKDMTVLSQKDYENKKFMDVAYFEPYYLKDFVATVPKNKVLK
ncbi:MAG TPA: tRNA (adenosine(37)-N6)-threonylcarbamoyltransferase complex dimerization subunit type 1 TsaB [Bacteroidales bacterium]